MFRDKYRNYTPDAGKRFWGVSLTVPDQSMPLKTLLERHSRGLGVTGDPRNPVFNEDLDQPQLDNLDRIEREQYLKDVRENIHWIRDAIAREQQRKAKAKAKDTENMHKDAGEANADTPSDPSASDPSTNKP